MATASSKIGAALPQDGSSGQLPRVATFLMLLEDLIRPKVKSRTTNALPGSPAEGDIYIQPSTATGTWPGATDDLAIYHNGWTAVEPWLDLAVWIEDESLRIRHDGTNWQNFVPSDVADSVTVSSTVSQGQAPLTHCINRVTAVPGAGGAVTLPPAKKGRIVVVANADATDTLTVFPDTGDAIDALSVNTSIDIIALDRGAFVALDDTTWLTFKLKPL